METKRNFYKPMAANCLAGSLQKSVQAQLDLLFELDTEIGRMAYELNRAQRVQSPRLSLPFIKTYKVHGQWYDYKPLWIVQRKNRWGEWRSERLDIRKPTHNPLYLLNLKSFKNTQGSNQAHIRKLVRILLALMEEREELLKAMCCFKQENAVRIRRTQARIRKGKNQFNNIKQNVNQYVFAADQDNLYP